MVKKVIVIGAGLAGLSAGIHLREKGIAAEIFELSGGPGGMCIAWERGGYWFDGCIHWMVGTKPKTAFNRLYLEVGALKEDTPIYHAESIRTEIGGIELEVPLRLGAFRDFLMSLSPQDKEMTEDLCRNIKVMMNPELPAGVPSNVSEWVSLIKNGRGFLGLARKYTGLKHKRQIRTRLYAAPFGIFLRCSPRRASARRRRPPRNLPKIEA